MPLSPLELDTLLSILRRASADHVMPRFRNLAPADVAQKTSAADLVTLADTEAEVAMTAALRAAWPDALVVGEEAVAADPALIACIPTADRVTILDPVDGTWNFAKGLALFGMIAAVAEAGRTVAGVLYDPVFDDWILATEDGPAVMGRDGAEARVLRSSAKVAPEEVSGYVPLNLVPAEARPRMVEACADMARMSSLRCSCHEYRMIAQGHVEFCLSGPSPHAWDHAAGALIVTRAGGVSRMLDGRPYTPGVTRGHVLTAGSEQLWDLVAGRFAFLRE